MQTLKTLVKANALLSYADLHSGTFVGGRDPTALGVTKQLDAWEAPLVYRSPGPVHRNGWDLYSVGPNGVDEQGKGDDILVGENRNVAPVGSAAR